MARKTNDVHLSNAEWQEIYYSLESKVNAIKAGYYGPENKRGEDKRWIGDINSIMEKIASQVDV